MFKLVYCVRKRADKSDEEFHRYWLEEHGPLARSLQKAIHAARYVQSHTVDTEISSALRESRGAGPPYDGITEMWWTSREEFEAGLTTDEGRAAAITLLEDEKRFVATEQCSLFMTEEHEIF
jgi:uncharacterized protein (TIGR02118 family)